MDDLSFINPRHPSPCTASRPFSLTRTNLYPFLEESEICTESPACGNLKVFLRIKPEVKDATVDSHLTIVTESPRRKKLVPRSSRFSEYISKNSIPSSTTTTNLTAKEEKSNLPLDSSREIQQLHARIRELEGILEDAQLDHNYLEKELNEAERAKEELTVTLSDKKSQNVDAGKIKKLMKMCQALQVENEDLKKKLKDSEDINRKLAEQEGISQKEIQELNLQINKLKGTLHAAVKAHKNAIEEIINAENCVEEQRKHYEETALGLQNKTSKLKPQVVKEDLQNKVQRYEDVEEANQSLKNAQKRAPSKQRPCLENGQKPQVVIKLNVNLIICL